MVVGHNPNLSQFLGSSDQRLRTCEASLELKKGAVAKVGVAPDLRNATVWCLTPKIVRALYDTQAVESSRPKTSRK